MSIIYEALKKTQDSPKGENPAAASASPKEPPRPKAPPRRKQASLALAGIALGIFLAWALMNKLAGTSAKNTALSPQAQGQPSERQTLVNPLPPGNSGAPSDTAGAHASGQQTPHFILNGIVLSDEGNLALINGQVSKVGDEIEGAKIEEIANKQVVLSFKNQKIVLKNK